jgi:hypothetical protein
LKRFTSGDRDNVSQCDTNALSRWLELISAFVSHCETTSIRALPLDY